jgi:modulator of FtsH protease
VVFFGMASLSTVIKRDLSGMGKFLFIGAIMLLVAGIANVFIQSSALMITLSVLAIGIFSAFMLYDLKRVHRRRRDQLHQRHAGRLPEHLQRVPEPAGLLGIFGGERD